MSDRDDEFLGCTQSGKFASWIQQQSVMDESAHLADRDRQPETTSDSASTF